MTGDILAPTKGPRGTGRTFDLNRDGESLVYDVRNWRFATVQALGESTWGTAVITIRRSNDGVNPVALESGVTLTAPGMTAAIDCKGFAFLHVDLTTKEGGADVAEIIVCAKRER